MKNNEKSIFDYGRPNQRSYPLKNFCSAALKSLKGYIQYEQEITAADAIVGDCKLNCVKSNVNLIRKLPASQRCEVGKFAIAHAYSFVVLGVTTMSFLTTLVRFIRGIM